LYAKPDTNKREIEATLVYVCTGHWNW